MTKARGLLIVGLLLFAKPTFAAPLGFESGDINLESLNGWMFIGNVRVVGPTFLPPDEDFPPSQDLISPTEGSYQAMLTSEGATAAAIEDFFGLVDGTLTQANVDPLDPNAHPAYTQGAALGRNFQMTQGDMWTFDWNFSSTDAFNDAAWFVMDSTGTLIVKDIDLIMAGTGPNTGYSPYSFMAPSSDTFLVGVAVLAADGSFNSYLTVDNFNIVQMGEEQPPASVPEPSTLLLLTAGWGTAFVSRRFVAPKKRS